VIWCQASAGSGDSQRFPASAPEAREVPVTVVQFPTPPAGAAPTIAEGATVAAAVDRYLDSIQAR